jgi:guanylate kinase
MNKKGTHACFIGPTSVGKSTLFYKLFDCYQKVLGVASQVSAQIKTKKPTQYTYWVAPGMNDDFGYYEL